MSPAADLPQRALVGNIKNPPCTLCRKRKVRCDGLSPCTRCLRAKTPVICTFIAEPVNDRRPQLPKGAACLPCRKRKRRCDGNVPCQGCKSSRLEDCRYQYDFWTEELSTKPIWRVEKETCVANASPQRQDLDRNSDTSDDISTVLDFRLQCRRNSGPVEPTPGTLYFVFNSTPMYGTPSARVSPLCLTNELYSLRNTFLAHCWQYGLNVTLEKREALSRGETLGIIHPALVNICQLVGYFLAMPGTWIAKWGLTEGEATEARAVSRVLDSPGSSVVHLDATTSMQLHTLFNMYYAIKGDDTRRVTLAHRMQAVYLESPPDIYPDESTSEVFGLPSLAACCPHTPAGEARAAFSRMMTLEIVGMLLFREEPMFDSSLRDTFRLLMVTNATDTEMNFLHAKSALLLLDSRSLVEEWDSAYTLESTTWHKRYELLIEDLTSHLSVAKTPLLELSFIHPAQILTLKTCILMTLAALANLHSLFAPLQPSSRAQHAETIDEMALISSSFVAEDYRYFEATISLAWAVAVRSVSTGTFLPLEEVNEIDAEFDVDGLPGPSQRSLDIIRGCNATFSRWFPFVKEA
ncbi:hypothetical protein FB45DRAFT_942775 [Roridomyces roridus]|uniref:Zn(2)-C6 fungal-type domain-containing protein n=1 Tax=Roridomyces roridus TaxID=1738132 RepID=A0AAD7F995_9AGAR|nr:hypothetical protein FB45DRAFT_942775 [Roridomyces roridus]